MIRLLPGPVSFRVLAAARIRHQRRIVAALYEQAVAVPCGRRAVFAGGLRGADKTRASDRQASTGRRTSPVSIDLILAELARRRLIPVAAGLFPMDGADQVHAEAHSTSPCGSPREPPPTAGTCSWTSPRAASHLIAPISGQDAPQWAHAQHRRGQDDYANGGGNGGRYVPAEAIRLASQIAEAIASSDWLLG